MSADAIVIVGAGQAGGWAATTLRSRGFVGRVVLLGDEPHAPYERPPLSKAVLGGQAPAESTELFSAQRLAELDIAFHPGIAATRLRLADKRVETSDGASVSYAKLILCMGGRPVVPPLPGVDSPGVHVLRTRDDALRLRARLGPDRHVVIVGGGWIGLEVAATARQAGSRVTVLEQAARLCARSVQPGVSAHLAALHGAHGVDLRLGASLSAIHTLPDGRPVAELSDGTRLTADAVVLGVGLAANDALAREAGIACDRGVRVDAHCRTSAPDVYAAGDVAVSTHPATGDAMRLESWQNAQDQGMAAALAALGESAPYAPTGAVWSEQYGAMVQIVGFPALAQCEVLRPQADRRMLLSVSLDAAGRAVAGVAVDAPRELRQLRKWIAQGAVLDPALVQRPDVPLASAQIG
ncbi:Rhodocoxin reductase [Achromobacter deleyi]|uniref:Rhodocoxin reductase n=1 Tax=Achromobacter deleyi TaxID=1353891 RepID=A0A6S7A8P0_9BURK|nr:FAD-dependent oxidoreductase [Achromobacter deleyi]CAB3707202.1 Rhodocoxin reductase [Achromobacter deleyi]CAB3865100.1 Rhodocoxin reductase [Achromobacter deleyi]CAB3879066.1 Rhodocoxin reductase [Achromobacter deleyi]